VSSLSAAARAVGVFVFVVIVSVPHERQIACIVMQFLSMPFVPVELAMHGPMISLWDAKAEVSIGLKSLPVSL